MESLNVEQLQEPSIAAAYYDDYHNSHIRVASSMKIMPLGVKTIQAKKPE
jgi:hypothetical protein